MLNKLKFVSVFPTIQGEGVNCGKSTTFIRLHTTECFPNNRVCSFCDTINKKNYNENLNILDIEDYLNKTNPNMITITGGEPLACEFNDLKDLISLCNDYCDYLEIETNGAYWSSFTDYEKHYLFQNIDCLNVSPKLKISNVRYDYNIEDFFHYGRDFNYKFVVSEKNFEEEIVQIADWQKKLNLLDEVWLMPMTPSSIEFEKKVFDFCVKMKYNYSTRLHITLFGNIEKEI